MKSFNKEIGSLGERIATAYLIDKGHIILKKNFTYKRGEIDIISSVHDILVFTEVKSRYTDSFGSPIESVTYLKQKQIINLSHIYLLKNNMMNYNVRYDVIEVSFNKNNDTYTINHFKDAFRTY